MMFTVITPTVLGRMCLKMIRPLEAPASRAASTNSRSRSVRNSPRTRRASGGHEARPISRPRAITVANVGRLWARTHEMARRPNRAARITRGMMMITSVRRISTASVQPRKYPERPPTTVPTRPAIRPTTIMTTREYWVPCMAMANRSRPRLSWPNGCSPSEGGSRDSVGRPPLSTVPVASGFHFHHPGMGPTPSEVTDSTTMNNRTIRDTTAPVLPKNRWRTSCPWLLPRTSSGFSPVCGFCSTCWGTSIGCGWLMLSPSRAGRVRSTPGQRSG